jgi:5-methylcytosine-specific restriction endonuclease McrA
MEYAANYRANHRKKLADMARAWRKAHPEILKMYHANRKALIRGSQGDGLSGAQWKELCQVFQNRCAYCGKRLAFEKLTQDHITPVGIGAHALSNIVPACNTCNNKKKRGPVLRTVQPLLLTVAPGPRQRRVV